MGKSEDGIKMHKNNGTDGQEKEGRIKEVFEVLLRR